MKQTEWHFHVMSCPFMSFYFLSFHALSFYVISFHGMQGCADGGVAKVSQAARGLATVFSVTFCLVIM